MAFKDRIGLTKEQVRRIVLSKLKIVYRDWAFAQGPFWHREPKAGQRRIDPRSFETALHFWVACPKPSRRTIRSSSRR
jgi:hypothetical protein